MRFTWKMRVIAGSLKGRRLISPTWSGVRPTTDRLRETLFNILRDRVDGANVLDGYAGTGAIGLEAISRGAASVTFIDRDNRAVRLIQQNLALCEVEAGASVVVGDIPGVFSQLRPVSKFDLVILDPPYGFNALGISAILAGVSPHIADDGQIIVERGQRDLNAKPTGVACTRRVASGDSALEFYARTKA